MARLACSLACCACRTVREDLGCESFSSTLRPPPHAMPQDGLFSLDIALMGPHGRVAVEVDGPYHFTLNTRQPTGATLIRVRAPAVSTPHRADAPPFGKHA